MEDVGHMLHLNAALSLSVSELFPPSDKDAAEQAISILHWSKQNNASSKNEDMQRSQKYVYDFTYQYISKLSIHARYYRKTRHAQSGQSLKDMHSLSIMFLINVLKKG